MFCMHCGKELPTDASFCPNCGRKAETPSDAPVANTSVQADHAAGDIPEKLESAMNYSLIITVLALFNCGSVFNLILGIIAILHANRGNRHLESGDLGQAEECAKTARMLCLIATGIIVFQVLDTFFVIALMILFYAIPILMQ